MKVGEYIRTKPYGIRKILEIGECMGITDYLVDEEKRYWALETTIISASPNIINLIEVGDYVNGEKIIKIGIDFADRKILIWGFDDGEHQVANAIYEQDIKSILTKEQFEEMEYKV